MLKVESGIEEPVGKQLFRKTWSQVGTNPRSALVIGVAAAGVGLKRLIGTLVPAQKYEAVGPEDPAGLPPKFAVQGEAR